MTRQRPVFGISLLRANPSTWVHVAHEAERLGFESVWMSDHLVLPTSLSDREYPDGELPIQAATPVFDVFVHLAAIAATTTNLRLGTYVYLLGLRHPFVAARAVTTLDAVSGGRVELGVGAGWLREEYAAAGCGFEDRGARLEAALAVCRRLWTEGAVAHDGRYWSFPPVAFEPKPIQRPHPPVHMGGESAAALRRALDCDGWIGMHHTPQSAAAAVSRLRAAAAAAGRLVPTATVAAEPGSEIDVDAWSATGVDRVIVAPWRRSPDALAGMQEFATQHLH